MHVQHPAIMVTYVYKEVVIITKVASKCVQVADGVQCVMTTGIQLMPVWRVNNLDTHDLVLW